MCRPPAEKRVRMMRFAERDYKAALAFAAGGGQGLHVFTGAAAHPGAPVCFKRSEGAAHLFDGNKGRLLATAKALGVRRVKIELEGTDRQHVDLCGGPLRKAIGMCG